MIKVANNGLSPDEERKQQRGAVMLLSMGTFLEYFDLMLYVHMAPLLNSLFFPESNAYSKQLMIAFGFCATYFFRPIGALIFGYVGDKNGRRFTVFITMGMMAVACLLMMIVPPYAKLGIWASVIVILCRVLQGMSSIGELTGAQLYLTESIPAPKVYTSVGIIASCTSLGGMAALGIAAIVTNKYVLEENPQAWRYAFLFGLLIAVIGFATRITLREAPEYADANIAYKNSKIKLPENNSSIKTVIYYFILEASTMPWFYFSYMHCGALLETKFGFTAAEVIDNNFFVSLPDVIWCFALAFLASKVHPFKIVKFRLIMCSFVVVAMIYMDYWCTTSQHVYYIQVATEMLMVTSFPARPLLYKCFPVMQRFRATAITLAFASVLMKILSSFGVIGLYQHFGSFGLGIIFVPCIVGFAIALRYFENLVSQRIRAQAS